MTAFFKNVGKTEWEMQMLMLWKLKLVALFVLWAALFVLKLLISFIFSSPKN